MKFATLFATACAFVLVSSAEAATKPAPVASPTDSDWRTPDPQNVLVIDTNKGRIFVEMSPEAAPAHVQRVRELTRAGFYDGKTFFGSPVWSMKP